MSERGAPSKDEKVHRVHVLRQGREERIAQAHHERRQNGNGSNGSGNGYVVSPDGTPPAELFKSSIAEFRHAYEKEVQRVKSRTNPALSIANICRQEQDMGNRVRHEMALLHGAEKERLTKEITRLSVELRTKLALIGAKSEDDHRTLAEEKRKALSELDENISYLETAETEFKQATRTLSVVAVRVRLETGDMISSIAIPDELVQGLIGPNLKEYLKGRKSSMRGRPVTSNLEAKYFMELLKFIEEDLKNEKKKRADAEAHYAKKEADLNGESSLKKAKLESSSKRKLAAEQEKLDAINREVEKRLEAELRHIRAAISTRKSAAEAAMPKEISRLTIALRETEQAITESTSQGRVLDYRKFFLDRLAELRRRENGSA